MKEIWKDIPGYEGLYEVSNLARYRKYSTKRIHAINSNRDGYMVAWLTKNSSRIGTGIHRLVALAFIPNPNNYKEINHIDGDKSNNSISNLEWCTRSENIRHAFDTGLKPGKKGEDNGRSKLSNEDIIEIRKLKNKLGAPTVGEMFSVSTGLIYHIWHGRSWKHI